jgi:hypothetical protein
MFSTSELIMLRSSLEVIQISGKDAKAIASLQTKLEDMIVIQEQEQQKNTAPGKTK